MGSPNKLIIITVIIVLIIITILSLYIYNRYMKKRMLKKINNLDIIKNEILSLPFQSEIDKASNLTKGEQLEEKVNNYKEMYNSLKENSFKKIEDMIIELDLIVNSRRKKEFNQRYSEVELELYKNRYLINHLIDEIKELTSYEDKYRGIVIKLKNKYRIITREYEAN